MTARETSAALAQVCGTCSLYFSSFASRHLNQSELVTRTICELFETYYLRYALLFVKYLYQESPNVSVTVSGLPGSLASLNSTREALYLSSSVLKSASILRVESSPE